MRKQYIQPEITLVRLESNLPLCGSGDSSMALRCGTLSDGQEAPDEAESGGYRSSLWN